MKKKKIITKERQSYIERKRTIYIGRFLLILFVLAFLLVFFQIINIAVTNTYRGNDLEAYGQNLYTQQIEIEADRGEIYDVNGTALAINITTYDMYAVLDEGHKDLYGQADYVQDPQYTTVAILEVLDLEDDQEAYDFFMMQLSQEDVYQVEFGEYGNGLTLEQKNEIDELDLPGIDFTETQTRYYPYGDFASYVIGYAKYDENQNLVGEMGVEKELNGYLSGTDDEYFQSVDYNGIPIDEAQSQYITKTNGVDVYLTIDAQIQTYIQTAMDKYLKDEEYELAYTIVMDAETGGILGAYAVPSFDPNKRDVTNYINPFSSYCFEPGSTIKTFVVAIAIEEETWDRSNESVTGKREVEEWGTDENGDPHYVADWTYNQGKGSWGTITWEEAFYYSSNTVMTVIQESYGYEVWDYYMKEIFQFGRPVNSTFMTSSSCKYNPTYPLEYANTAFGQGMTVNSLQMLRAYSPFANNGYMVEPHVVDSMVNPDTGEVIYSSSEDPSLEPVKVLEEETVDEVLYLLEGAVYHRDPNHNELKDATGKPYSYGDVTVGGKTGTSEIAGDDGYQDVISTSSVVILAPIEDPEIVMYTVVVNPTNPYPTTYMGPMVTEIVDNTIKYLDSSTSDINLSELDDNEYYIESYLGRDIDEVASELKSDGINVITIGEGEVITQYPNPDQTVSKNETVVLKADGEYDYEDLIGLNYTDSYAICQAMLWDCSFSGIGTVTDVEKVTETSYNITLKLPYYKEENIETDEDENEDKNES